MMGCDIMLQVKGDGSIHGCNEFDDAIVEDNIGMTAQPSAKHESREQQDVDDVANIGQWDTEMDEYFIFPSCSASDSVIPQDPFDVKPPPLPLNHPPSLYPHGIQLPQCNQISSKIKYILFFGIVLILTLGVLIGLLVHFDIIPELKIHVQAEGKVLI